LSTEHPHAHTVYTQSASLLFFKRFYCLASVLEHDPLRVMPTCIYLACKVWAVCVGGCGLNAATSSHTVPEALQPPAATIIAAPCGHLLLLLQVEESYRSADALCKQLGIDAAPVLRFEVPLLQVRCAILS
jgi:hypothetical protein